MKSKRCAVISCINDEKSSNTSFHGYRITSTTAILVRLPWFFLYWMQSWIQIYLEQQSSQGTLKFHSLTLLKWGIVASILVIYIHLENLSKIKCLLEILKWSQTYCCWLIAMIKNYIPSYCHYQSIQVWNEARHTRFHYNSTHFILVPPRQEMVGMEKGKFISRGLNAFIFSSFTNVTVE